MGVGNGEVRNGEENKIITAKILEVEDQNACSCQFYLHIRPSNNVGSVVGIVPPYCDDRKGV
jgi:hypothetical protein